MTLKSGRSVVIGLILFGLCACNRSPNFNGVQSTALAPSAATFTEVNTRILQPLCLRCHSDANSLGGKSFQSFASILLSQGSVIPYQPYQSPLYRDTANGTMPPPEENITVTGAQLQLLYYWIAYGAPNN